MSANIADYTGTADMQFVERTAWIPSIHADFNIGVDGLSMPLLWSGLPAASRN